LSFTQRRLWFLHQMRGPSPTYNIPLALRLSGMLDREALRAALGDVVARHESLRTIFPQRDGMPYQHVFDPRAVGPVMRLTHLNVTELPETRATAARYEFDLAAEPGMRAELFALAPDEHVLLVVIHHIAGDGWSMGRLWRDMATAYAARRHGQAPGWAPLAVQHADYSLWQHQLPGDPGDPGSLFANQLAYVTHTLAGLRERVELPTDRTRPPVASHCGECLSVRIDTALHQALIGLARQAGASVFMVLQAGLAALLSKLGAGPDIPIGSPIAGRTDQAMDDLVGFFVNTLVLRTDTSGNPSFRTLLGRVRSSNLAAYGHQELPFERLVEVLNPARSLSRHPLFQVMLAFQNTAPVAIELAGLSARAERVATSTSKFDLSVSLGERRLADGTPAGITGIIEYASDLFDRASVAALGARLVRLLEAAVATPDAAIGSLEILAAEERARLLEGGNATSQALEAATLPALVARQAQRTPDAVAVVFGEQRLTYAELDAHANQLAHHLIGLGVGAETVVGLAVERSLAMVVGLIGILKAGAAYLPLDPGYPRERLAFMLADAQPPVLLTQSSLLEA